MLLPAALRKHHAKRLAKFAIVHSNDLFSMRSSWFDNIAVE
jgi:hypothetical protein